MAISQSTLPFISDLVHAELQGYLPEDVHIDHVTSEILPAHDGRRLCQDNCCTRGRSPRS